MSTPITEVPWMIEGGAKHTVQVARNLSYMAAGGTEGIIRGAHLEVRETEIPGPQVRVFPGTVAILNRAAGASDEMYVLRVGTEQTVDIAPTDASGGRSDLIVARVENPWASGETWPDPADPTVGPYASLAVISGVASNVTSVEDLGLTADHSMIALARVDLPASTTDISQAMVVDLRVMANSVVQREMEVFMPSAADALTTAAFADWSSTIASLDVPEWATHVRVRAILAGVSYGPNAGGSNVNGDLRIRIGGKAGDYFSSSTRYNLDNAGGDGASRATLMCADPKVALPATDRGARGIPFALQGRKVSGNTSISVDDKSTITLDVEFLNEPESNI
jgi:hypothetical protein